MVFIKTHFFTFYNTFLHIIHRNFRHFFHIILSFSFFIFPNILIVRKKIKKFKEIMFSKKEQKIDKWIKETKKLNIPEINSFINRIRKRFRGC